MSRQCAFLKTKKSEHDYGEKPPLRGVFLLHGRTPGIFDVPTLKHVLLSSSPPRPSSQDRLLYLDIAEDFLSKAKRFYPPKDDSDEDVSGLGINLPLLLARVEAMNGRGNNDEEEDDSEKDDGNLSDRF